MTIDASKTATTGLTFARTFSSPDIDPFDAVTWRKSTAAIKDEAGKVIFSQEVEAPDSWSDQAVRVVSSKYFYGDIAGGDDPARGGRESSARQLVGRVTHTIARWGLEDGYFASEQDAKVFDDELTTLCVNQYGAFNSPVWFNVGLSAAYGIRGAANGWRWWDGVDSHGHKTSLGKAVKCVDAYANPQCSACFILSVADDMESILERAKTEGMLFKYGSGVGADSSKLRSTREKLSSGGRPSGPVSFIRIYDSVAAQIKSGGAVRRAARMDTLKDWHPDVLEFAVAKTREDGKARALVDAGYSGGINGEASATVAFQNANFSVRCSDEFLKAVEDGGDWTTKAVTTGADVETFPASRLMDAIAEGTWVCGDPGVQYETTIQRWHTLPNTAPINSSNPCCFTGDTLVRTSEGKLPIAMLARMDLLGVPLPMAFAFDHDSGLPVLRQIEHAWKAGSTRHLVEVMTDNGLKFRSTPEHRYYLRTGQAVEAQHLKSGDRLRKIGRGSMGSKNPRRSIETKDGTFYQSRWMWEQANGPIPDGHEVHHKNEDRWDDRLSNFELKAKARHRSDHATGLANANSIECPDSLLVETWEAIEAEKGHASVWRWNAHVKAHGLKGIVPLARGDGRIRGMGWVEFSGWIEENRSLVNDRIVSVERIELDTPADVYDIEVDGVHNFGITTLDAKHDIVVSNSEYMSIDDSACNLASLNLMKFRNPDGTFNTDRFRSACRVFLVAQEITVDRASYPTAKIAENAHKFRQLGLGYCGLGALLMSSGLPYDSDEGRSLAGAVTAIMHGQANLTSAEMAEKFGAFDGYAVNREPMTKVMGMHRDAARKGRQESTYRDESSDIESLWFEAVNVWDEVIDSGDRHGYRNSQVTVLAPTGTIAFMMDSGHSTGMEPGIGLVQYKTLAGGGMLKITNPVVPMALDELGYAPDIKEDIIQAIEATGSIEKSRIHKEDLPVFDCAFEPEGGGRSIHWRGHVKMMGALQPFLSGAISKTVNLPREATVADIKAAYLEAWKLGVKAVAIFRDGSKESQPVSTSKTAIPSKDEPRGLDAIVANIPVMIRAAAETSGPRRSRLPDTRSAVTHKLSVGGVEAYLTVGEFPDGRPGEVFVTMAKEGSTLGGLMDGWATAVSIMLQYGIPVDVIVKKFEGGRFEPAGMTRNPGEIPIASSLLDYVARWLGMRYVAGYREVYAPKIEGADDMAGVTDTLPIEAERTSQVIATASHGPLCGTCGSMTVPTGRCFFCPNCMQSIGGCG